MTQNWTYDDHYGYDLLSVSGNNYVSVNISDSSFPLTHTITFHDPSLGNKVYMTGSSANHEYTTYTGLSLNPPTNPILPPYNYGSNMGVSGLIDLDSPFNIALTNNGSSPINVYNLSSFFATIQPGDTGTFTVAQQYPSYNSPIVLSNLSITCFHPETLVNTSMGIRSIDSIKSGDMLVGENGQSVEVVYNIKNLAFTKKFIKIYKGALGNDLPMNDLLITKGHPIIINGQEIEVEKLVNGSTIINSVLDKSVNIYSICTKERTVIMIEGILALTWAENDWIEFTKKHNVIWEKY